MITPPPKKKKIGRPKLADHEIKKHCVKVYFDSKNYQKLVYLSKKTGLSKSVLLYKNAIGIDVKERLPQEFFVAVRGLSGMANNLNQLTHLAHIQGSFSLKKDIETVLSRIGETLEKLSKI